MGKAKKLKKIMSRDLIVINENEKLESFSGQFRRKGVHHLLVENDKEELVGIMSSLDIAPLIQSLLKDKLLAKHIMTPAPFVLSKKDTVHDALEVFMDNVIRAIPIVDKKERLVGIVTPYDLLQLVP